ncbi:hypothetical protein DID88_002207 [Monilinia fructigena]|uniref:BZIP domain-containing protein n=1 Tax=Monilinia fructigena TaxID=38457 RepID=A0A395IWE0_9HELO|nr:hypothetical protein DID88_002207 [Monilinia fructigena]
MFLTTLALLSSGYTTKPLPSMSITMNINEIPRIEVLPMPQRSQVQNHGEDWTGTSSTTMRRKLQNRLNQRASRQRRKAEFRKLETMTKAIKTQSPSSLTPHHHLQKTTCV